MPRLPAIHLHLFGLALCCSLPVSLIAQQWNPPTTMKKLPNGLTVVISEDHSSPTFGVCVSYGIGFRLEPEGRTGFAHLFEHLIFETTPRSQILRAGLPFMGPAGGPSIQ